MITVFSNEPFVMITDDNIFPQTAPASYTDWEGRDQTVKNLYLKIVRPFRHPDFEVSREGEFLSAEDADAYIITRIILSLSHEPVFPAGLKHFGFKDIEPSEYIFRFNQACVYVAKATRRGLANHVICNADMKEFFEKYLQPEKHKHMTFEVRKDVPDKIALMCYKGITKIDADPYQPTVDFPITYSNTTKRMYIHEKYLDYFALIDLNV
jgi:hypothetical protein